MKIEVFEHDLPEQLAQYFCNENFIGIDCETTAIDDQGNFLSYKDVEVARKRGLDPRTSKLSIIQISDEKGEIVAFIRRPTKESKNLKKVLTYLGNQKIVHYAIFDNKFIFHKLGYHITNIFCTRTLSKMVLPKESSSLDNLATKFFNMDFKTKDGIKFVLTIDHWEGKLDEEKVNYAALDVAVLGKLRLKLLELADPTTLKYFYSIMHLVPGFTEEELNNIYLKLNALGFEDILGFAKKIN